MARARPVVASAVGGTPEVITDRVNGRLVAAEDVVQLADALAEVLSDRTSARSMGEAARQCAIDRDPLADFEAGIRRLARWAAEDSVSVSSQSRQSARRGEWPSGG
jgi:glycosyltransferase involved in cell wall biosynthesis